MPRVKIDHVVSFSNEDPDNQASNLLSWEVSKKKWLCSPGEPSCSVVLQLARAVKISSVQIGAYHTALVEVLVGRSETPSEPFQVLVPRSVFLSPKESRGDEARDRVRSFDCDAFTDDVCTQRWDRVRLVCSQPYNKHHKYGLSFIHIFEPDGTALPFAPAPAPVTLSNFALDTFPSDDEDFRPGELFAKHRQSGWDTVAQIRQATSQALKNNPDAETKLMKTSLSKNKPTISSNQSELRDRRRDKDNVTAQQHETKQIVQRHNEVQRDEPNTPKHRAKPNQCDKVEKTPCSKTEEPSSSRNSESKRDRDRPDSKIERVGHGRQTDLNEASSSRRKKDESRKRTHSGRDRADDVSASSLQPGPESDEPLRGVVFVLSGYENPRRARLRDLALSLGAQCRRDWGPACTHLICAFDNTPKLKAVRASRGGADVPAARGAWLEECGRRRRMLPWQWFAAERERCRDEPAPAPAPSPAALAASANHSDSDTDDEIVKVLRQQRAHAPSHSARGGATAGDDNGGEVQFMKAERIQDNITVEDTDDAGGHTDAEDAQPVAPERISAAATLPAMFEGRTFVLDKALVAPLDVQLLTRYCIAYGGLVLTPSEVDQDSGSHYVLVGSLCAARDKTKSTSRAIRVRADWLWACHALGALCPLDGYV